MPQIYLERELPYTQEQLYMLVADIESYPQFVPWCIGATIDEHHGEYMIAELTIGYKGITKRYTSRVHLDHDAYEISVELAQGLFKHLYQGWKFTPLKDGSTTRVEFDIDFALRSKLMEKLFAATSKTISDNILNAFVQRAKQVCGPLD